MNLYKEGTLLQKASKIPMKTYIYKSWIFWSLFMCRTIIYTYFFSFMVFGRPSKPVQCRPIQPNWPALVCPAVKRPYKKILGINYCSTHKKASKNPQFVNTCFHRYFWCLLKRGQGVNIQVFQEKSVIFQKNKQ